MQSRTKEQGSVMHIIIIVVLVAAILGALGFVFLQNFGKKTASTSTSQQANTQAGSNLPKKYTSTIGSFAISYPDDWTLKTTTDTSNADFPVDASSLTSPSGTVLNVKSFNDARGGTCGAKATDVPFAAGNDCASIEYLSAEKLPIDNAYELAGNVAYGTSQESIYLTTSKYGYPDGTLTYTIGALAINPAVGSDGAIALNKPTMGYSVSEMSINRVDKNFKDTKKAYADVFIYAQGHSESFLTSKDADTMRDIIRSLVLY